MVMVCAEIVGSSASKSAKIFWKAGAILMAMNVTTPMASRTAKHR